MRITRKRMLAGGVCLLLLMGAAACGGAATGGAATGKQKPILIGSLEPLTGAFADSGLNSLHGLELAVDDINKEGGIKSLHGAKLKLVSADVSSSDTSIAADQARKLARQDGMAALVGDYLSAQTLASQTVAEQSKVPLLTQSFSPEVVSKNYKYTFKLPPSSDAFGSSALEYSRKLFAANGVPARRLAGVFSSGVSEQHNSDFVKAHASEYGFDLAKLISLPSTLTDASSIVQQISAAHPDAIAMTAPTDETIQIVRGLSDVGVKVPIIGVGATGTVEKGFAAALGDAANGTLTTVAWNWDLNVKGLKAVTDKFDSKYDVPFMPMEAGETYVMGRIIAAAIEKAGSADPQAVRNALASIDITTGLAAAMPGHHVAFNEKGQNKFAIPVLIEYIAQKPRTVYPPGEGTAKPAL